jgi:hypothetical protein
MSESNEAYLDDRSLIPGAALGRVGWLLRGFQALGLVAMVAGALILRREAAAVPPIIAFTADNRPLTGKPAPYAMNDARFSRFATDVVESSLTRNEKGLLPGLIDYITPAGASKLEEQFRRNSPKKGTEFVQTFSVDPKDGVRIVSGNPYVARVMLKGTFTVRSDKEVSATFYWGAAFVVGPASPRNPLGWRLNDIFEISKGDYYEEDTEKAASEAVKITP